MDYSLDNLTEVQKELYNNLLDKSKGLYPDYPEHILKAPILFYIMNDCDEDCFKKLEQLNKKSNDIIDTVKYSYEEPV